MAAAVGSLMMRMTSIPAITPASLVACADTRHVELMPGPKLLDDHSSVQIYSES